MNIPESIITVLATVAGAVAIAYTTLHLQAKHRKHTLFRALYSEIKANRRLAEAQRADPMFGLRRRPERRPLYTEAYRQIRLTGDLLELSEPIRQQLEFTYELVDTDNEAILSLIRELDRDAGRRLDKIIQDSKALEGELPKYIPDLQTGYHEAQHEPEEHLLRRYLIAQVPTFFFFGLSLVLAYRLLALRSSIAISILERVQDILSPLLILFGGAAIAWAFALFIVGLNYKIPRKLKWIEKKILQWVQRKNEPFFYVASMTVFGISFAAIFAGMIRTGIGALHLYVLFGVGILLALFLFVHNLVSVQRQKRTKTGTTQNSRPQNHDA